VDTVSYSLSGSARYTLLMSYRNDELINLRMGDVSGPLTNEDGQKFIEFRLVFRKTNKDAKKGTR
jgi:hypothetical protein